MKGLRLTCPLHGAAMDLNIHVEKKNLKIISDTIFFTSEERISC